MFLGQVAFFLKNERMKLYQESTIKIYYTTGQRKKSYKNYNKNVLKSNINIRTLK